MQTSEGRTKDKLKVYLKEQGCYQFWPVQTGYGAATVDCLACIPGEIKQHGYFHGIECKRQGLKKPTNRQAAVMREIRAAGGTTWLVTLNDLDQLEWVEITE
jgi:hypothetical protein